MTAEEYRTAVLRAEELSCKLSAFLGEDGLDLFEEYCENYKNIVKYETFFLQKNARRFTHWSASV